MRTLWTLLGLLVWPSLYVSMTMPEPKTSSPPHPLWNQSFPDPPPGGLELPPHPGFPLDAPPLYARHPDETPVRRSLPFSPEPDPSYCQMLLEAPVPPPIESVPWFCICSQCKGTIGPKGDHGERGLPGSPGSPGRRGFTGFRGPPGFMGRMGLKGQKGDDGEKGNPGLHGFSGPKGERGFKGDKGDLGLEGPPGPLGPQGEPGQCPDKCETIPSAPGEPGLPGPTGARGLPGEAGPPGAEGEKGDLGPMGPPGAAGADGQKGDQGPEGECECKDGINGTDGQPGPPGHKGEQGLQGIQGDPGINGEKGEKGDLGMTGDPGPCSPTIQSAFSATLGSLYPAPNLPVPFTQVIYNRPGNYNPETGIYTAPINATYVFSYHLAVSLKPLKVGLFRNFLPVVKSTEVTDLGTTSQQVVLHLSLGDRVWMQVRDSTSNGMYASSECSSTFSGFLLYPDSCDPPMLRDYTPPVEGEYSWGHLPEPSTPSPTTTPTSSSTPEPNPT